MSKLRYWLTRLYVSCFVYVRNLFNIYWHPVQGVYLPLRWEIGFNTLRWIVNGEYENGEIELIRQRIDKSDKVIEIGTGLGFVSSFCAKIVGSDNVYSFEANPLNVEIALAVYEKNNVMPHLQNALLSDTKGEIDFPVNTSSRLASSVLKRTEKIVNVPKLNLNETIKQIKPTFLIMDIEGAEYEVFRIINFQTITKIQVELHPSILGEAKIKEIFDLLYENNFNVDISIPDGRNYFFKRLKR